MIEGKSKGLPDDPFGQHLASIWLAFLLRYRPFM